MLRALNKDQAHFIALLAKVARMQRDKLLGNVSEEDPGGTKSSRGEHNPTALLGFEPLPPDAEQLTALGEAISSLTPEGRAELHALMRVGQGDLAAQDWDRGLDESALLGEQAVGALMDDPDLHDHLVKALYEMKEAWTSGGAMKVYVAIMAGTYFAPRWSFGLRAGGRRVANTVRSSVRNGSPNAERSRRKPPLHASQQIDRSCLR